VQCTGCERTIDDNEEVAVQDRTGHPFCIECADSRTDVTMQECQCEANGHAHGDRMCSSTATHTLNTRYGKYRMCADCAKQIPQEFLK